MKNLTLLALFTLVSTSLFGQGWVPDTITFGDSYYIVEPDGTLLLFGSKNATYVYTESLHLGGIDAGGSLHVSAQTYKQDRINFFAGPVSGDPSSMLYYGRTWTVTQNMIDSLRQGLYTVVPDAIANWPAHGRQQYGEPFYLAPFVDMDNNGYYNTGGGDYPFIKGDITTLALFNDQSVVDSSNGNVIGADGYFMYYMYDEPGISARALYRSVVVTNRSSHTYSEAYLSIFNDADAGGSQDDLSGTDIERHAIYSYNADDYDFMTAPKVPYCGTVLLEGPTADAGDGVDNNWDGCIDGFDQSGNCIPENASAGLLERLTMTNSMYYNNTGDPVSGNYGVGNTDIYNYMRSLWRTGDSLRAETPSGLFNVNNGDGYEPNPSSQAVRYAYPGNSHSPSSIWAPDQPINWFESPSNHEDKRVLLSMGPFTWEAGETINITSATFWGNVDSIQHINIIDSLTSDIDSILYSLVSKPLSGSEFERDPVEMELRQNNGHLTILNPSDFAYELQVLNVSGQILMRSNVSAHSEAFLNCAHLPNGVYLIRTSDGEWTEKWIR